MALYRVACRFWAARQKMRDSLDTIPDRVSTIGPPCWRATNPKVRTPRPAPCLEVQPRFGYSRDEWAADARRGRIKTALQEALSHRRNVTHKHPMAHPSPRVAVCCLWLCLCYTVASAQRGAAANHPKPRVSFLFPSQGAVSVPLSVNESIIRFDADMSADGQSLLPAGRTFLNTTEEAFWRGRRELVIPIHLRQNRTYAIALNGDCRGCKNFRSVSGVPLDPILWSFSTWAEGEPWASPQAQSSASHRLLRLVLEMYAYRDRLGLDWRARWQRHRGDLSGSKTGVEFAEEAAEFLSVARDGNVFLDVGGDRVASHVPRAPPNVNMSLLRDIVADWRQPNRHVALGRFGTSVRYISVRCWEGGVGDYAPVAEALESTWRWPKIMLDVRESGNGNESRALEIAAHFVNRSVAYARHRRLDASADGGFGPVEERVLEPKENGSMYDARLAVLMGPANMGAGESFLLMMRAAGATLIGGTSYGNSGHPRGHALGNGVAVFLPSRQELLPNGELLEGRGIDPDVRVEWEPGQGEDPVVKAALERL